MQSHVYGKMLRGPENYWPKHPVEKKLVAVSYEKVMIDGDEIS